MSESGLDGSDGAMVVGIGTGTFFLGVGAISCSHGHVHLARVHCDGRATPRALSRAFTRPPRLERSQTHETGRFAFLSTHSPSPSPSARAQLLYLTSIACCGLFHNHPKAK